MIGIAECPLCAGTNITITASLQAIPCPVCTTKPSPICEEIGEARQAEAEDRYIPNEFFTERNPNDD